MFNSRRSSDARRVTVVDGVWATTTNKRQQQLAGLGCEKDSGVR